MSLVLILVYRPKTIQADSFSLAKPHPRYSRPQTPPTNGKGSGDIRAFSWLCCVSRTHETTYSTVRLMTCVPCGCHMTADTAQPRKCSNATRPFPICGWGLGTRLHASVRVWCHPYTRFVLQECNDVIIIAVPTVIRNNHLAR